MSVEEFKQTGPTERLMRGQVYDVNALPGAVDPADEHALSGHEPHIPPTSRFPFRRRFPQIWQALTIGFLAFMLGAGGILYYFEQAYQGHIYPNVSIQGVSVGQMTPVAASEAVSARYAAFLKQPVTLVYADRAWSPSLAELGMRLEVDAAVQQAFMAGRDNDFFTNLRQVIAMRERGFDLPLHLTVDEAVAQDYLLTRAPEVEQSLREPALALQGAVVERTAAVSGRQLLVYETLQDVIAAAQTLEPQTVPLRTRELSPLLDDAAVAAAQREIATLLQAPLTLTAGTRQWEWSEQDLAEMLDVQRVADNGAAGSPFVVELDREQLQARLRKIAATVGSTVQHPRVDWNGGDLKIIREGTPGRVIDVARAETLIMNALGSSERVVELPFHVTESPVTAETIGQIAIPDLLAVGRSDFTGSAAYRVTNIKAGMNLLHGILLAPGEEFSFNQNIGAINAANGFVEGYAIIQNRTQLEWGGGICQDSTTMFRAAFWAGLPITERHGHSFYINWYDKYGYGEYGNGPGMDATIFTGGPDFRFVNDTGHWVLIQTAVDTSRTLAEVRLYGTDIGRTVEFEGPLITNRTPAPTEPVYVPNPERPRGAPRQTDTARGGMTIMFERIVQENGVEVDREQFVTKFKPWPDIFEVHPYDMPGWRPAPAPAPIEQTPAEEPSPEAVPETPPAPDAPAPPPEEAPVTAPPGDVVPIAPPEEPAPEPPPQEPPPPQAPPEAVPTTAPAPPLSGSS